METTVSLQQLGFAWISILKSQAKLFGLESKLAQASIGPMLICIAAMTFFSISLWVSAMALLGYGVYLLMGQVLYSLLAILALNFLAICFTILGIQRYKKRMSFEHTRAALREYI